MISKLMGISLTSKVYYFMVLRKAHSWQLVWKIEKHYVNSSNQTQWLENLRIKHFWRKNDFCFILFFRANLTLNHSHRLLTAESPNPSANDRGIFVNQTQVGNFVEKFSDFFFQILRLFVTTFDYYSNMNLIFWLNPDQTDYYCKVLFYDRTRGSSNSCSGIIFRDHLQSPL